jgi:membrane-associated phospholipid phosphatase
VAIAALGVLFLILTMAVAAGMFTGLDMQVLQASMSIWYEPAHPVFQAIALLGGLELTTLLMVGLGWYLIRGGFGVDAWALSAFIAASVLEVLYKANLNHIGPPRTVAHEDGPSITMYFSGVGPLANSFPSGHVVRAVVVYGLCAFVIRRLAVSPLIRALAIPVATAVILLVSFDRIYLDVHWESDVLGGLLLGFIALLGATVWLDRPRAADN